MDTVEDSELCFPQLNSSCRKLKRPQTEALLIYLLLSFITLLTPILNLLAIVSISHFRQLHTPTNLLLLSLAVSDLVVGLLMSFCIMQTSGCWFLGDLMCALHLFLMFITTSVSIGNMVLISVDRYLAICDPLRYATKVTVRAVRLCICLCWICSVLYNGLILKNNLKQPGRYNSCSGQCAVVINNTVGFADLILTFIIPVIVIIVLYMRVFVVAVTQARAMRFHIAAVSVKQPVKVKAVKSELKAARTLGVVVLVFLICLCPHFSASFTGDTLSTSIPTESWLFYFNSCLNPVIYAFFYPWFLKSVKLILTLKILQPNSCNANIL